ncbi:MAG: PDZ domain-containing protein [Planctomycetota bacterium]|nr:PDZ domain-containing protein [Planctomycetota bacterium]
MTINRWQIQLASFLLLAGSSNLYGQDFLKQLEDKLFQKQQESKAKEPAAEPSEKQSGSEPFELPSVLNPESVPTPGLLKPEGQSESLELPPPKAPTKAPPIRKPTKPTPAVKEAAPPKASPAVPSLIPSPFPKTTKNTPPAQPSQTPPVAPTGGGGFLGLTVESIPGGGFGLTVVEVTPDSPAWKAGFRNGDKVIGVSGQAVSTVDAFSEQLGRFAPGAPVKFLVDRRGKTANLIAVLQDRAIAGQIHGIRPGTAVELEPGASPIVGNRLGKAYFGVNVADMSDAFRRQFSIPAYRGASVTEVIPNSPAHSAGLKPGDCIVEIEGNTVQSAEVVFDTIVRSKPGQVISFSFYRGRQLNSVSVPLASDAEGPGRSPTSISPEMLTPEYVANLQGELERVHSELSDTQARLQQLEARLQRMESNR